MLWPFKHYAVAGVIHQTSRKTLYITKYKYILHNKFVLVLFLLSFSSYMGCKMFVGYTLHDRCDHGCVYLCLCEYVFIDMHMYTQMHTYIYIYINIYIYILWLCIYVSAWMTDVIENPSEMLLYFLHKSKKKKKKQQQQVLQYYITCKYEEKQ